MCRQYSMPPQPILRQQGYDYLDATVSVLREVGSLRVVLLSEQGNNSRLVTVTNFRIDSLFHILFLGARRPC